MVRLEKNFKEHIIRKWSVHYLEYDTLKNYIQRDSSVKDTTMHAFQSLWSSQDERFLQRYGLCTGNSVNQEVEATAIPDDHQKSEFSDIEERKSHEIELPSTGPLKGKKKDWNETVFVEMFLKEIERVAEFFTHTLHKAEEQLTTSLEKANEQGVVPSMEVNVGLAKSVRKQKKDRELSVLRAYVAIYKKLDELESFAFFNCMLAIKILKKHDKLCSKNVTPLYPELMDTIVYQTSFGSTAKKDHRLNRVKKRTIELCAEFCCDGDLVEAKGKLKMTKGGHNETDSWYLGCQIGVVLLLVVWFLWEAIVEPENGYILWNDPALYVYSFIGNLIVYDWLWAISVSVWERCNVNYLVLLDLSADHSPSSHELFSKQSVISMVYLADLILYYKARRHVLHLDMEPHYFIMFIALFYLVHGVLQAARQRDSASHRLYSPSVIFRIVTSPFSPVTLREIFTADVMTSCIKVYSNCAYAVCYLLSGAYRDHSSSLHNFGTCNDNYMFVLTGLLALLPLWFRFAQCLRKVHDSPPSSGWGILVWPHSYNAVKYTLSMIVVIMGLSHPLSQQTSSLSHSIYRIVFIILLVTSTLYSTYWDVFNDWSLFQVLPSWKSLVSGDWRSLDNKVFLRRHLMYKKNKGFYYVAMVLDLLLRGLWTLSLIPQGSSGSPFSYSLSDQLGPFLAMFELCRRCIWGIIRLDKEHVSAGTDGHTVALHFEKNSASNDSNTDLKIAIYHFVIGSAAIGSVFVIAFSVVV